MAKDGENLNRASWMCILFGHKFQPRYDTRGPRAIQVDGLFASELIRVAEARKLMTYRVGVCERCGSATVRPGSLMRNTIRAQQESETSQ